MSSGAAPVAASDLKVAGVMGIFEAAIGVPALKAVSRLIRELLRTRTGGPEIAISRPCNWTELSIHSAGDQPVTPTAVTARFALKPEGTSADRGFRAGRPGGGVAAQYRDGSA